MRRFSPLSVCEKERRDGYVVHDRGIILENSLESVEVSVLFGL